MSPEKIPTRTRLALAQKMRCRSRLPGLSCASCAHGTSASMRVVLFRWKPQGLVSVASPFGGTAIHWSQGHLLRSLTAAQAVPCCRSCKSFTVDLYQLLHLFRLPGYGIRFATSTRQPHTAHQGQERQER